MTPARRRTGTFMPVFQEQELRDISAAILEGTGTPPDLARIVGDSLVDANLVGHDSHGVLRVPQYVEVMRGGAVVPDARPQVVARDRATARIDGNLGWGQPGMLLATETAIELAREHGVGAAVLDRGYHIGRVAPYVESAARAGMVGIAMSNAGAAVAPYGGRDRVLGTNPFAWAMPRGEGQHPLSFDIATAGIAEGKLRVAQSKNQTVASGLIVDIDGQPTTNPDDFYAGGAILPFGGHKGNGLALLAQLLGHTLIGPREGRRGANEATIIVLDVASFGSLSGFTEELATQCARISSSAPAEGFSEVLLPGEIELRTHAERSASGIFVPESIWDSIIALADELGVAAPVS